MFILHRRTSFKSFPTIRFFHASKPHRTSNCLVAADEKPSLNHWIDLNGNLDFPTHDFKLWPEFITEEEEVSLLEECDRKFKGRPYEDAHFDDVIHLYRELQASRLHPSSLLCKIQTRLRSHIQSAIGLEEEKIQWKPLHVLDLSPRGHIGPHLDHVEYSGSLIAGLCLHSTAVMRFERADAQKGQGTKFVRVLLPQRCLYLQTGRVRYEYKHSLVTDTDEKNSECGGSGSYRFNERRYPRQRRVVLLLRNAVQTQQAS